MVNIESNELFDSIKNEIEKRIEKAKEYLEKKQERLKDTTKKIGILDKISINSDIKSYQEQIRRLTELSQSVANLRFSDTNKYKLPDDLKSQFDRLGTLLSEQEIKQLRDNVNDSLKNVNKDKKERVKQEVAKIQELLSKLKIGDNKLLIYNKYHKYTGTTTSFNNALKKAENIQLKDLTPEYSFVSSKPAEIKLGISDEILLSSIEKMIKSNPLEKDKSTQNIIDNFSSIKEAFGTKAKLDETLLVLSNTLSELGKITEVDFSKVQLFLKQVENNYKKELDKTNKFLDKFDFTDVKKQIEEKKEREEKDRLENSKITEYQQLAYELEKFMSENPNDYEKIQELKEAMRQATMNSGLTNEQLEVAMVEGKTKYQNERQEQKAKVEAVKEKIAYEDQLKADVMRQIREYAIRELESSGAFKEDYEYRNGDVYSKPMDKEAMIQRKIAELKKLADMTPEERGLEDQKRRGYVSPDTKLEDLTPQQLNDLRVGYRDSSYEFMTDYKDWQAREQIKPQANNVYREYIKYRAALKDKTQFLSFTDYAKQLHNIENMSDIMVDEELKDEVRGMAK